MDDLNFVNFDMLAGNLKYFEKAALRASRYVYPVSCRKDRLAKL
jgi:hypothetical protein